MMHCRSCRHASRTSAAALKAGLVRENVGGLPLTLEHHPEVAKALEDGELLKCAVQDAYVDPLAGCEHHSLVVLGTMGMAIRVLLAGETDHQLRERVAREKRDAERAQAVAANAAPMVDIGAVLANCPWCARTHPRCRLCRQLRVECALCPFCGRKATVERANLSDGELWTWQCKHVCRAEARGEGKLLPARFENGLCEACSPLVAKDPELASRLAPAD
jgi:hypothetical protein